MPGGHRPHLPDPAALRETDGVREPAGRRRLRFAEAGGGGHRTAAPASWSRPAFFDRANQTAGSLGLLQRKRLELARALATDPKVLLLDEIAGGLTEGECHALVETIRAVHARGMSIIWIEHVLHALNAVVGRLLVLNFGKVIGVGQPDDIMASRDVREIYLGIEV